VKPVLKLWYINLGLRLRKYSFVLAHGEEQGVLTRSIQLMHGAMKLHHGSWLLWNDRIRPNQTHYSDVSSR